MNIFCNKHVIVGVSKHVFTNLYIDILVNKASIDPQKLIFLTLDSSMDHYLHKDIDIKCVPYRKELISDLSRAESFTLMSFTSINSFFVKELYDFDSELLNKVHVYLTDDEVDRWRKVKLKKGQIVASKKYHVGPDEVRFLPYIKSFITLEKAFRKPLNEVLGRNDFNILDVRDPFATMPSLHTDKLNEIFDINSVHDLADKRVLLGSKRERFSLRELISLFKEFKSHGMLKEYKFLVFTHDKARFTRIVIDLYCLYMRYIKKTILSISYPTATNSLTYTCLIMSCSHFILQPRGGISSARQYIANGRGVVCVPEGSPNDRELSHGLGLDVIRYQSFSDLVDKIARNNVDIQKNREVMQQELVRYYNELARFYS